MIKKYINCPLCNDCLLYSNVNNSHIWSCQTCPFIGFEFYDNTNLEDLKNYLNNLKKCQ